MSLDTVLWVPLVGTGTADDLFRPDIPDGMFYSAEIPSELSIEPRGVPAVTHCRIQVHSQDVPKITKAVRETDVRECDRYLIRLCAMIRKPEGFVDEPAVDELFDSIPDISTGTPERKQLAVRLLDHASDRGLASPKRAAIAERLEIADIELEKTKPITLRK